MEELTTDKSRLLNTPGHVLALGGPGSGKTYIALLKADKEIRDGGLSNGQRILFLSFARATIARVAQQAGTLISKRAHDFLEISTYHGFAWNLLQSHGYLLNASQEIRLLPPPEAASHMADVPEDNRVAELRRLFEEEGRLHFDLFAALSAELLTRSKALARIIGETFPIIILDEFQDTNADEWAMIQALGLRSRLIALADAEQRIYEFRGADPKRIPEFITTYSPTQFDFGTENNRSNGTDIVTFGNDLLTDANKSKRYRDVEVTLYPFYRGRDPHFSLKTALLGGINRLKKTAEPTWSIAVLVPSKKLMLSVSDYLSKSTDRLPSLSHDVALDTEAPSLAAVSIAQLLEGGTSSTSISQQLITSLCTHLRGRKGAAQPTQGELALTNALGGYVSTGTIRGARRLEIVNECSRIAEQRLALRLSGNPEEDWLTIRELFFTSAAPYISQIAEDAKYLRLLHKGATLRSKLGTLWKTHGSYLGAEAAVRASLLEEHFSASVKDWKGINVMTIHKSKGKEFDEVFIYEGQYAGRIVFAPNDPKRVAQARLALRVAVTRAKKRATILSPGSAPCPFLIS